MSSDATPRLGLPDMPETPELYPDIVADAFTRLDAFTDLYLKGQFVNTPPSAPADGDAWLIGGAPTGAWQGYAYKIATCRDGGWTMLTPFNGLRATVAATGASIVYADGVWTDWNAMIGAGESNIASAATCDIGAAGALFLQVTGNTAISSFGTAANKLRFLRFAQALTLTHHATRLILPGAANIVTAAGDTAIFASNDGGNWRCHAYQRASGQPAATLLEIAGPIGAGGAPAGAGGSVIAASGNIRAQGVTEPRLQVVTAGYWTWSLYGTGHNFNLTYDSNLALQIDASGDRCYVPMHLHVHSGHHIATNGAGGTGLTLYGSSADTRGYFLQRDTFCPTQDSASDLGLASFRWGTVYAVTGAINTSDETEKQWRGALTDAEFAAGKLILAELGGFKFLTSIAQKGEENARLHWGARAQRIAALLADHGLDPNAYSFICHDAWPEVQAEPEEVESWDARAYAPPVVQRLKLEGGEEIEFVLAPALEARPAGQRVIKKAIEHRPAGSRWGLRYDGLIVFLLAVLDRRLAALEAIHAG